MAFKTEITASMTQERNFDEDRSRHGNSAQNVNPQAERMRVLLVAEGDNWGGIETHLMTLLPYFASCPGLQCEFLLFSEGALSRALRARGMVVTVVQKQGFASTVRRIVWVLRHNRFDVVHMHSLVAAFYLVVATAVMMRALPLVWTIHGKAERLAGLTWVKDQIARRVVYGAMRARSAATVVCVSNEIVRWVKERYRLPDSKIVVVRNGIGTVESRIDRAECRRCLGIAESDIVVIMVGRLVHVKGHAIVLEAVAQLRTWQGRTIRLVIVGDGPLRAELEQGTQAAGLGQQVTFLGMRDDVLDLVNMADIYAMPSLDEGIPYSLLEAMALAKPIIAANVGGIPEAIENESNGLLVRSGDVKSFVAAMQALMGDADLAARLAAKASLTVGNKFAASVMAEQTMSAYRLARGADRVGG